MGCFLSDERLKCLSLYMASCGSIMPWLLMVSLDPSQALNTYAGCTSVPSLPRGFSCNEINNKIKIEIKDTSTLTPSNISPRFLTRKKCLPRSSFWDSLFFWSISLECHRKQMELRWERKNNVKLQMSLLFPLIVCIRNWAIIILAQDNDFPAFWLVP